MRAKVTVFNPTRLVQKTQTILCSEVLGLVSLILYFWHESNSRWLF